MNSNVVCGVFFRFTIAIVMCLSTSVLQDCVWISLQSFHLIFLHTLTFQSMSSQMELWVKIKCNEQCDNTPIRCEKFTDKGQTPGDDKSSHGLLPGDLKIIYLQAKCRGIHPLWFGLLISAPWSIRHTTACKHDNVL